MTRWKYKSMFEIKWLEPYGFTFAQSKIVNKNFKWWICPLYGICLTAMFIILWFIANHNQGREVIPFALALLISLVAGFGLVYFISFSIFYLYPREVGFSDKAIAIIRRYQRISWSYEQIHEVMFEKYVIANKNYRVMVVNNLEVPPYVIAIPGKININNLIDFLKDKGVEIVDKT